MSQKLPKPSKAWQSVNGLEVTAHLMAVSQTRRGSLSAILNRVWERSSSVDLKIELFLNSWQSLLNRSMVSYNRSSFLHSRRQLVQRVQQVRKKCSTVLLPAMKGWWTVTSPSMKTDSPKTWWQPHTPSSRKMPQLHLPSWQETIGNH